MMSEEVAVTFEVAASPDRIWTLMSRFGEVAAWNPFLASSRLVSGIAGEVGAEREVVTTDGAIVRERLERLDELRRELSYRMLTFPLPVTDQTNCIAVGPGGDGARSRVTFTAHFDPKVGALADDVAAMNRVAFTAAANGIGLHVGGAVVFAEE